MAVYFPRGQLPFREIKAKFESDLAGARRNSAKGVAFVTNQELTLGEREELRITADPTVIELYHLERLTAILDDPNMEGVREQFLDIEAQRPPAIDLGGKGGSAPGAGGGGGGAQGSNATGGSGGPGGDIHLHGTPGEAPGAGGGAAGAIGDDAVGGQGGGGGEARSIVLGPDEIGKASNFHHFKVQVGKGGTGGGPGEDTILNLCDKDDKVLRSIVVRGGQAGAPAMVPPPHRIPTDEDVESGLRVTGILAANIIYRAPGNTLWTVIDAGWDIYQSDTNPFLAKLPLLIEVQTGAIQSGSNLDLKIVVLNPDRFQVHEQLQTVAVGDGLVRRSRFFAMLEFTGSQSGLWRVQILAGPHMIGEFTIEFRLPT
jgi:hypothetical protein